MLARPRVAHVVLVIAWFSVGCLGSAGAPPRSELVRQRDDIGLSEIQAAAMRVSTGLDLVRSLRPEMLVVRNQASLRTAEQRLRSIEVYIDESPHVGLETLAAIPARDIARVQRLTPVAAGAKYGGSHPDGVIVVTTLLKASASRPPERVEARRTTVRR